MFNEPTPASKRYFDVIDAALKARGQQKDDYEQHPVYREARYVIRMCEVLCALIGRDEVSIDDVLRVERCASGHVDYHSKFALYCLELAGRHTVKVA